MALLLRLQHSEAQQARRLSGGKRSGDLCFSHAVLSLTLQPYIPFLICLLDTQDHAMAHDEA